MLAAVAVTALVALAVGAFVVRLSGVYLAMLTLALLVKPKLAATMAKKGWGAHLLDLGSIRVIESDDFR